MTTTAPQTRSDTLPDHLRAPLWQNWGKTTECRPAYFFQPAHVDDLYRILAYAAEKRRKIRLVTSGHSWSALVPTDSILISMNHFDQVTMDLSDSAQPRVVIGVGATVRAVNDVLEKHGFALPLNVVLESVRFGGLIATGSHGSGWHNATLSDLVHAIDLISATGELHHFEQGIHSDEVMNAVRLNLGMFGIMLQVTLNIQKSWHVRAQDRRVPIPEVLNNLEELVCTHDNLDLFWWPFTDRMWVKSWQRTDAPITAKPRASALDRWSAALTSRMYREALRLAHHVPTLTPLICRTMFLATPSVRDQVVQLVEAIHYRRSIEVATMGCVEVAFKINAGFANVKDAIQTVFERTKAYAARHHHPFNVTMNVRFIDHSQCLLSPAYGEGHTCYIEILSRTYQKDWFTFSGEIGAEWLKLPQARPHWAKEYRHIPGVTEHLKRTFGENITRFNKVKQALGLDPDNLFVNDLLGEVFL
ncbi:MAG: FAD-binding protein [Anaerolinea sp.]|nr:FAD-binding protein [Anaerolinea sp.]